MSTNGGNLIFLISQPRAGSTLFQLLLSGHPDIATTSEPWIALHPLYALRKQGIDTIYNANLALSALSDFLKQSGASEDFYREETAKFLSSLYGRAIEHQHKRFFLDKTPRYHLIVKDLINLFPEAKFIILFRNPLAVLNSILKSFVKGDCSLLGEFMSDLMLAPKSMTDAAKEFPDRCFRISYEELVADTAKALKEVCSYLGIPYMDSMLVYENRINPEWRFGDAIGIFKSGKPTLESLDSWKKAFVTPQERLFAVSYIKALGPEIVKEMGYDYATLETSIQEPEHDEAANLISWATLMSEVDGFSKAKEVRKMVFKIIMDGNVWKDKVDRAGEDSEWREVIKSAVKRFRDDRLYSLMREAETNSVRMSLLKTERDKLKADFDPIMAERDNLLTAIDTLRAEKNKLAFERKQLEAERDRILSSVSWRISAPLRKIGGVFIRGK